MNKQQAISYAQITLNYMQSSKYREEITPDTLGVEMKQSFRLYSKDIVQTIANAQAESRKKLQNMKSGSDKNE